MFWSRLLSPTFMNKPPWVNELSAIALFLVSNKAILAGRCLNLYCDNLVCVYVLKKGLANIDSITDGVVQRLIISISGIDFRIQYTPTSNNPADYISRYSGDRAELPDERCIESTCISDLTLLDSKTFKPCADLESYMKKNHESVNKMKEAAVSHWDINLTKKRFKDTQVFSDSTYQNDDIIALCRNECIPDILNVEEQKDNLTTAIETWRQPDTSDDTFVLIEKPYKNICPDLFQSEHTDSEFNNFFRSENGGDMIDFLIRESKLNPYTDKYMRELRHDTHFIASNRMLSAFATSGIEGLVDQEILSDRTHLSLTLQEIYVINQENKQKGIDLDSEPIFKSYDEIRKNIDKYQLSPYAKSRISHF